MGFIFGVVVGILAGIAAVVLFVRRENTRSKQRCDLAVKIAAFARMTVEDSRKLLPPPYCPSWVVFSQRQKAVLDETYEDSSIMCLVPFREDVSNDQF